MLLTSRGEIRCKRFPSDKAPYVKTMAVTHISAVTLAVGDMARSVEFYQRLGFKRVYGGANDLFTSLRFGNAFVNLQVQPGAMPRWWGRVIFRVDDVDAYHERLEQAKLFPDQPRDARRELGRAVLPRQ